MTQRVARISVVFAVVLFCSAASAQTNFNYSITCAQATVGPMTLFADTVPNTGSVTLTPNVPVTGLAILSGEGPSHRTDSYPTSGSFSATRSCTLTFGGVSVNYAMPLSVNVTTPVGTSSNCTPVGFSGGCLTTGPATVTVNLGAQGTVSISAPAVLSDGFDTSEGPTIGFVTVVPGSLLDTALLTSAAPPPATPLPPSLSLVLTGLACVGLYQVRRKFARA
jgi:hypothetical protein